MRVRRALGASSAALLFLASLIVIPSASADPEVEAQPTELGDTESQFIDVRLAETATVNRALRNGIDERLLSVALPATMASAVHGVAPVFHPSLLGGSLRRASSDLPDLGKWVRLRLAAGEDAAQFVEDLQALPNIEIASIVPSPAPPPADTPDFTALQGSLDPAPTGSDARYAWTVPGGTGLGVTIFDVEYSWNQEHEDLDAALGVPLLLNPGDENDDPFGNFHGTGVLGILVATNDDLGVTGIAYDAEVGLAPANTTVGGYNPANAILLATAAAEPGDVILLEQQVISCTSGAFGPIEWLRPVYDAIVTATANGIVVVAAAGNGALDLDQPDCLGVFDRSVQDSGAIIVGAGLVGNVDRQRASFSSYGSRVDVQGWGLSVATTGGGGLHQDIDDPTNEDRWYTGGFSGTSSASATLAGFAANLQGAAIAEYGEPLSPRAVRDLLASTGSPQLGDTTENIGPRPDLQAAIAEMIETAELGDVDCDGTFSINDVRFITQYAISLRTAVSSCPLGVDELNIANADITRDGAVNISDAREASLCAVQLVLDGCPRLGG